MSAKIYLRILQAGIIASLGVIFFVFTDLLFPYITSKQLPFNILMEILLVFWLVFIWRYPEHRPQKSLISWGLIAYFVAILASCLVSVDINLSFWGDAERMLGFFHLIHFLIFYFILITVFRSWREWRVLFFLSTLVATVFSLIGLFGENPYSTIGNVAYVSSYLIFNIYFCVLLFFRQPGSFWRWFYIIPVLIMFWHFKSMHTSGAIIGLAVSVLLLFLLIGLTHIKKNIRRWFLGIFLVAIFGIIIIFSQHQSAWFQDSFLRSLTTQKSTFQTRLISWRGAAADFKNHPIFGTGFGNYAIIFDKHFDPKFFNYMIAETYFDRAHNNLIDITSTTGLLGLITYLSIFVAVLYYLWQIFRINGRRISGSGSGLKNLEILIIIVLLTAYFIQNLAIFDTFATYIGLMMVLGFIYYLNQEKKASTEDSPSEELEINETDAPDRWRLKSQNQEFMALGILIIITYVVIIQANIKPWRMFHGIINGYSQIMSGDVAGGLDLYRESLSGTPLDRDARTILVTLFVSNPNITSALPVYRVASDLDYVISLAQKNVDLNPNDSLSQMQLAQILDTTARFYYNNIEKFNKYSGPALIAIDRSIEASPGRIPVYLAKAQILLIRNEEEKAIETIKYANSLNPNFAEGYCRLGQFYLLMDKLSEAGEALDSCAAKGGVNQINSDRLLKLVISYYISQERYDQALLFTERLVFVNGQDPGIWLNLAKIYLAMGDDPKAKEAIKQAVLLDPSYKDQADELLKNGLVVTTSNPKK